MSGGCPCYLSSGFLDETSRTGELARPSGQAFLLLVIAVSLAFAWILWPFFGAVFWATALAIMFAPLYRRLLRSTRQRRTLAALLTVLIILLIVILPQRLIAALLLQEGMGVYRRIKSGELNFGRYLQQVLAALPSWVTGLLERFGLTTWVRCRRDCLRA